MTQLFRHSFLTAILFLSILFGMFYTPSVQATPLYTNVQVSDTGIGNNIRFSNTSRNVAIATDGTIYVVYSGSEGIRVASSIDSGASFGASVQVNLAGGEAEITVASDGIVYVTFVSGNTGYISRSLDNGATFSVPTFVAGGIWQSLHIATDPPYVYLLEDNGWRIFTNSTNGVGAFTTTAILFEVFADLTVDPATGEIIVITDNPGLNYFVSNDHATTFTEIPLIPGGFIYYSTGAWTFTPGGRFWYSSGNSNNAYVINLDTGETINQTFGTSFNSQGRQLAANGCNLVDGFSTGGRSVAFQVSDDRGTTFNTPVVIPADGNYISLAINPVTDDIVVAYEIRGQVFVDVYRDEMLEDCPEIDILGAGASIVSGDVSPAVIDDTEFATIPVGNAFAHTFTIENNGFSALNIGAISINGVSAGDFTVTTLPANSIAPGTRTAFEITFTPTAPGLREATISIASNDADESPYIFAIQGTATGIIVAPPAPVSNPVQQPAISVFDPGISKLGFLMPGQTGVLGEEIQWFVIVRNTSNVAGQNIVVSDTLVDGLQINRVDAPGGTVSINGQTISVTYPVLNPGESKQFSIFTSSLDGEIVINTVCVNASNQGAEECATGSVISLLPNTGESPFWHNWMLFVVMISIGAMVMGVMFALFMKEFHS